MRRLALAVLLSLAACDDSTAPAGGTGGVDGTSTGDVEDSSSEESTGGESGSSGGDAWAGEFITVRTLELDVPNTCGVVCGESACLDAGVDLVQPCEQMSTSCTCGDSSDATGTPSTHAMSDCYLDPNASQTGASMDRPEPWTGQSCDELCAEHGFSRCAWTQWAQGDRCLDWGQENTWELQYGDDMTVRAPFEPGEGGVVRFVCEL